ncbi:SPOR domain-containing protein [Chryseobacterium sp.]|uniref:SPOR domain-containing protein n=1 Tax=Chryseobacterium sp. TaxID=1871047 RepID=UPI0011CBF545|nr:SPOR domain-containing protein [Chryseobacterium sp.]TXF75834.1 SPOR domain-containing protein [Chryseobacterium sp.]
MKNFIKINLVFFTALFYHIDAQQVVKKDTLSGTELSMAMDTRINDALTKIEDNCERLAMNSNDNDHPKPGRSTVVVPSRALTNAEICRQNPRILGYKIQINTVRSNEEANEVKAYFRRRFPNLKVETDASLRPNYKILAGSYFTKQSAASDLARIREYFKSAIAVQYRVFCVEAK